jgi:hypothetical protein
LTLAPIAAFLAGSLLSLLLPVLLLVALVVWYVKFFRRVPETEERELGREPATPHPDPPADAAAAPGES